jgi:hypothetical protein
VALDCDDPRALAAFWATVLGGTVSIESESFCGIRLDNLLLTTVRVPDYQRPQWPDGNAKQFHLDVAAEDLDKAERLALTAGATKAVHQPNPSSWRVLLDPAGHPFCVTTLIPDQERPAT